MSNQNDVPRLEITRLAIDAQTGAPSAVPKGHYRGLALTYRIQFGLSVVPLTCGTKKPGMPKGGASPLMTCPMTEAEVPQHWTVGTRRAIGSYMGLVSGSVIVIDFDVADDYLAWEKERPDLASLLPTSRTRRGFQVYLIDTGGWTRSIDLRGSHGLEREIKGHKTLVVLPGSYVNKDNRGNRIEPHMYKWIVAPKLVSNSWPRIDLRNSGLVPVDFDKKQQAVRQIHTQDTQGTQGTQETQDIQETQGGARVGSGDVEFTASEIQELVARYPISGKSQRRGKLKLLVLEILRRTRLVKPNNATRIAIHNKWWSLYGKFSGTDRDVSWLDFDQMIHDIRGDRFCGAVAKSMPTVELPHWIEGLNLYSAGVNVIRLVMACDRHRDEQGCFYIAARKAADLAGVDKTTVNMVFKKLRRESVLELVKQGTLPSENVSPYEREANVYRVLIEPDGRVREDFAPTAQQARSSSNANGESNGRSP